jgi:nicotinamide-nucleotide amidase
MENIKSLAEQVGRVLQQKGLFLSTAESCTGGGIAYAITEIPGSSDWFDCGFVTYSNTAKTELLDVPEVLIAQFGAVSEEVVEAMVEGAIANSDAHVAVATTGIAGPSGAVPGKPVGTVCFGWARDEHVFTERLVFHGDRQSVREQSIAHALKGLLQFLERT